MVRQLSYIMPRSVKALKVADLLVKGLLKLAEHSNRYLEMQRARF